MAVAPWALIRELTVQIIAPVDGPDEVCVSMRYDMADPYAVHAVFRVTQDQQVVWVFARELLTQGLDQPSGEGDVRIWPAAEGGHEGLCIALSSPDGEALLHAPVEDVVEFLSSSYELCPRGREVQHLEIDRALSLFFAC